MKVTRTPVARKHIVAAAIQLGQRTGKLGWFESAKYADGTPVAGVAAVQELGSAKMSIPPRPYFRPTADEQAGEWARISAGYSRMIMRGQMQPVDMFEALCLSAEGSVRETITKLQSPALAESTKADRRRRAAKGKPPKDTLYKPLVDSGYMLATLTSQVE